MAKHPMFIINETMPLVMKVNPNPNSISIDREKIYSETQAIGGFVFEHWGERPRTLTVKGKTKPILGPGVPGEHSELGVESALFFLQKLYSLDKRMLVSSFAALKDRQTIGKVLSRDIDIAKLKRLSSTFIYYKFDIYNGFFTNFSFQQDAETMPRHYEYEFEFLVTSTAQSSLTDTLFTSSLAAPATAAASLASFAKLGSGDAARATALLAGNRIVKGITNLNI